MKRIQARLLSRTQYADVWLDDAAATANIEPERAAKRIDAVYAAVREHFGPLSYRAGTIVNNTVPHCRANASANHSGARIVPSRGERFTALLVAESTLGANGYSDLDSYLVEPALRCMNAVARSNEIPGLIVLPVPVGNDRALYDDTLVSKLAHELQHVARFVRHGIAIETVPDDDFVDEGLSELAQDVAVAAVFPGFKRDVFATGYVAETFLRSPQNFGIEGFLGRPSADVPLTVGTAGSYGGAYLLQRYLYDRFGPAYLRNMTTSHARGSPEIAEATGLPFADLERDFAAALDKRGALLPGTAFRQCFEPTVDQYGTPHPALGVSSLPVEAGAIEELVPGSIAFRTMHVKQAPMHVVAEPQGAATIVAL